MHALGAIAERWQSSWAIAADFGFGWTDDLDEREFRQGPVFGVLGVEALTGTAPRGAVRVEGRDGHQVISSAEVGQTLGAFVLGFRRCSTPSSVELVVLDSGGSELGDLTSRLDRF